MTRLYKPVHPWEGVSEVQSVNSIQSAPAIMFYQHMAANCLGFKRRSIRHVYQALCRETHSLLKLDRALMSMSNASSSAVPKFTLQSIDGAVYEQGYV